MKKTTVNVSMTFQRALPENNNRGDVKIERSKPIRFRNSIITAFCPATRVIKCYNHVWNELKQYSDENHA